MDLLEHVLEVLAEHPAEPARKLAAFALLNALTAVFVQNESAAADPGSRRHAAYLRQVAEAGNHPRIAGLLGASAPAPAAAPASEGGADRFEDVLGRALVGLLG